MHAPIYAHPMPDIFLFQTESHTVTDEASIPLLLSRLLSRHMSAAARVDDCDQSLKQALTERDRALEELARVNAEAAGLHQMLQDTQELLRNRDASSSAGLAKIQAEFNAAVDLNEKQNALAITLEAKVMQRIRKMRFLFRIHVIYCLLL